MQNKKPMQNTSGHTQSPVKTPLEPKPAVQNTSNFPQSTERDGN
jgi:hypothetical protein